ncbi:MAG: 7-cyano-7-deazaguanine synthase [Dehalococcoidia bacterium]|nr:7-cyano-7-deazaguanine synthase [Dehalococcoidia bacterium]
MSMVTLVSGGLDSALMSVLAKEESVHILPLFVDYGQICRDQEWRACIEVHLKLGLPHPVIMDMSGFGQLIPSGLTNRDMHINEDAFLPGRNLLLLLAGSAYAYSTNCNGVAIGLLAEEIHLFPDQTREFVKRAQDMIALAMNREIRIVTPLMNFRKNDVIELARAKGIEGTYSCHAGTLPTCGSCISCLQYVTDNMVAKEET